MHFKRKMNFGLSVALLTGSLLAASSLRADDLTVSRLKPSKDDPDVYLIDGQYKRGEALLLRMRDNGELPDTLKSGKCRFDLAGDTGVAYYVRSCD